ncbi:hypothetical protein SGFS_086410 [Streptomyces graminofaciens]|uniref:Uncharacterized protein n=1 Tax=Streptomyces graminofaciens TaxID=68212 RepID=A0ABM8HMA0_9ACTN|nr:hypothetical protein [Streptomyces graminofaciens]BBC37347.1 hypothetical protein SGFS_086410 [Streptomyces graminofaciens]
MDEELTALAAAGAAALIQEMVTDGWAGLRRRVVALFSRNRDEEAVRAELEESRAELVDARADGDTAVVADLETEWRNKLRRALRDTPEVAAELRALLDELTPPAEEPGKGSVHNVISGGVQHGNVIQAHTLGNVTLGEPGR